MWFGNVSRVRTGVQKNCFLFLCRTNMGFVDISQKLCISNADAQYAHIRRGHTMIRAFRNLNHVVLFSWHKLDRFVKFCHIFLVLVLKPKLVVWVMIKHLLKEKVFLLILPNICISSSTSPVLGFLFPCSNVLKLQMLKIARNKYKILFY